MDRVVSIDIDHKLLLTLVVRAKDGGGDDWDSKGVADEHLKGSMIKFVLDLPLSILPSASMGLTVAEKRSSEVRRNRLQKFLKLRFHHMIHQILLGRRGRQNEGRSACTSC